VTGTALVYGIALSGDALARQLVARGWRVVVADDAPTSDKRLLAAAVGAELIERPDDSAIATLVRDADIVCPAPGVPETHTVVAAAMAAGTPLRTEIDLAYVWEQQRAGGPRPMLAVTGTDGKTTTTMLTAHLLDTAGHRAAAVGNTEVPLAAALDEPVDVFAVECSSFRLNWIDSFRAEASVWLNLAPDHLNWHRSLESYEAAKARMWAHRRPTDVAIGYAADPIVMRNLRAAGGVTRTFGAPDADYRREGDVLVGPMGAIASVAAMKRALPHDITNSLAAAALVLESRLVGVDAIEPGLSTFVHPPHRIEPILELDGVRWFNDSKATTPHAALTAIRGFDRVVLLAGGRNKGLDLGVLARAADRMRGVVAFGEAGPEVEAALRDRVTVVTARSMHDAVRAAADLAQPGDAVLLSPACASFDAYANYGERGDDFAAEVRSLDVDGAPCR